MSTCTRKYCTRTHVNRRRHRGVALQIRLRLWGTPSRSRAEYIWRRRWYPGPQRQSETPHVAFAPFWRRSSRGSRHRHERPSEQVVCRKPHASAHPGAAWASPLCLLGPRRRTAGSLHRDAGVFAARGQLGRLALLRRGQSPAGQPVCCVQGPVVCAALCGPGGRALCHVSLCVCVCFWA